MALVEKKPKLALIVTDNSDAWNARRGLLKACVDRGLDTYLITPHGKYDQHFWELGVTHIPVNVVRVLSPIKDMMFFRSLRGIFRTCQFDIVHNIAIKPNIYGALAAHAERVPTIVGSITGLGNMYMDEMGLHFQLVRPLVSLLYRRAFRHTNRVWFQNPDDLRFFEEKGMISPGKAVLIRGSGIDTSDFDPDSVSVHDRSALKKVLGLDADSIVVTMVSRALKSKGVEDFIDAAKVVCSQVPLIQFLLVGDGEPGNRLSVKKEYLNENQSSNFRWLGARNDIKQILSLSDIVVLPSRFREGLPKSLLEAMAMEKPVVATDVPGCREAVEHGCNGFLIRANDPQALAEAIRTLVADAPKRREFGIRSRQKVIDEFSAALVNQKILEDLYRWKPVVLEPVDSLNA